MAIYLTQFKPDKHDLSRLKKEHPDHQIKVVFEGTVNIHNTHKLMDVAREKLAEFDAEKDFIVLMGVGIAQAVCLANLILRTERVPVLIWDANEFKYVRGEFGRPNDLVGKLTKERALPEKTKGGG